MKKVKYYYDSENLAYRKIVTKKRKRFGYIALFILSAAVFGVLSFIILLNTPFFETPKDRLQAREIENLKISELKDIKFIQEGKFVEKEGAPVLKLMGTIEGMEGIQTLVPDINLDKDFFSTKELGEKL